jgi:hypothetical protein
VQESYLRFFVVSFYGSEIIFSKLMSLFSELYRKLFLLEEGLLLPSLVTELSSHCIRSYITLKLRPHVSFGSEIMQIKTAVAERVKTLAS